MIISNDFDYIYGFAAPSSKNCCSSGREMECMGRRASRLCRELKQFEENPPHGISCWMKEDGSIDQLIGREFIKSTEDY